MRRWIAGVCVAATVAGCKTLSNALHFSEPEVQLQEIQITGIGLSGGTLNLALDVYNPNDYRLRSTRLELGVDLEDTHFGDALLDTPLDLPSQQHTLVTVPVRFEWAGVGAGARALLSRQAIRFGLTGTAYLGLQFVRGAPELKWLRDAFRRHDAAPGPADTPVVPG